MEDDTFKHFEELLDQIDFSLYEAFDFADGMDLYGRNYLQSHLQNFRDWRQNREKGYIKKGV